MRTSPSLYFDHISPMEAIDELSPREIIVVIGLIEGKTRKQAMLDAGYSKSMAETQQKRVVGRERVRRALLALLDTQGNIIDKLAKIAKEGLEARRFVGLRDTGEAVNTPDWKTRVKFFEMIVRILGGYPEKQVVQKKMTYEDRLLQMMREDGIEV